MKRYTAIALMVCCRRHRVLMPVVYVCAQTALRWVMKMMMVVILYRVTAKVFHFSVWMRRARAQEIVRNIHILILYLYSQRPSNVPFE